MNEEMPITAQRWDVHGQLISIIWFGSVTKSKPNIVPCYPGISNMLWNQAFDYCTEPGIMRACVRGPRFDYEYLGLDSPGFSWSPCDRCGSALGGERHQWYYRESGQPDSEGQICTDCLYDIEHGGHKHG